MRNDRPAHAARRSPSPMGTRKFADQPEYASRPRPDGAALRRLARGPSGRVGPVAVPSEKPAPRCFVPAECGGLSMHGVRKLRRPIGRVGGVICETLRVARFCAAFALMF